MIHNSARKQLPALSNPGVASDLRGGKQLVGADGSVVTGTLAEVAQATPSIAVSSGGLITASATQSGGIVAAGTKSSTKQLMTQAAKTVTSGTTNQTAVASGRYTTGAVTVKGDVNLKAENIAEGVSIFGVTGTHSGGGGGGTFTVTNNTSRWIYGVTESENGIVPCSIRDGSILVLKNSVLIYSGRDASPAVSGGATHLGLLEWQGDDYPHYIIVGDATFDTLGIG